MLIKKISLWGWQLPFNRRCVALEQRVKECEDKIVMTFLTMILLLFAVLSA